MDAEEQWERGLDQSYNQVLEQREALQLAREQFEDRMLEDKDFFADYAWKFMGTAEGYKKGLLDWSWEKYQAEATPAHTHAWMTEKELTDLQEGERELRGKI